MASSKLEEDFNYLWQRYNKDIELVREYQFAKEQKIKSRFDFAHLATKVAIECEGGTWSREKSGHTTGVGYQKDCVKYNLAIMLGWRVFRLTSKMIDIETVKRIGEFIRNQHIY